MVFIYNTLLNGWSVKMLDKNKFEFSKNNKRIKKEFYANDFIQEFIEKNMIKNSLEKIA